MIFFGPPDEFHEIKRILIGIIELKKAGVFSKETLEMITTSKDADNSTQMCIELHRANLLNMKNFNSLNTFILLKKEFDGRYYDDPKFIPDPSIIPLCQGWITLNKLDLVNKENCQLIHKMVKQSVTHAKEFFNNFLATMTIKEKEFATLDGPARQQMFNEAISANPYFSKFSLLPEKQTILDETIKKEQRVERKK